MVGTGNGISVGQEVGSGTGLKFEVAIYVYHLSPSVWMDGCVGGWMDGTPLGRKTRQGGVNEYLYTKPAEIEVWTASSRE